MLDFLKKLMPSRPTWSALLGWQVMTYEEGAGWLSLQIEPMLHGPCKVYVPDAEAWERDAPPWARERRDEIVQRLQGMRWNRDLEWSAGPGRRLWPHHVNDPWDRSLESTPGGRQLLAMRLFHADSAARFSKADAKRAWCAATEQMCLQIRGAIDLFETEIVPGSVFQEVAVPALGRNSQAQVNWISGRP